MQSPYLLGKIVRMRLTQLESLPSFSQFRTTFSPGELFLCISYVEQDFNVVISTLTGFDHFDLSYAFYISLCLTSMSREPWPHFYEPGPRYELGARFESCHYLRQAHPARSLRSQQL